MKCLSCSKQIPAAAQVCPYCQRGAITSAQTQGIIYLIAFVGGLLGYLDDGWGTAIFWAITAGAFGGILVFPIMQFRNRSSAADVRIVADVSTPNRKLTSLGTNERRQDDPAARLMQLAELRQRDIISEEEYAEQREAIIREL